MKLSIVATLYMSASHIGEFHARASAVARQLVDDDYEIVFVNDGSLDASLELAVGLGKSDPHIVVVDLSRNFGHHRAMMIGLDQAIGDQVFLIDSDLEEEPEWLYGFAEQMASEKCDVVYGVQGVRKGGWFERLSGDWFYRVLNFVSGMNLPQHIVTARLMSRRYVDALLLHKEREIFIVGLWNQTGFDQQPQVIQKHSSSETSYTFRKKISLVINAVTSFSNAPLIWVFNVGVAISFLSAAYVSYLLINWALFSKPLVGWTSVMASIWLVGGMIICFTGVVGIYLSKMFIEVKQRPYAIIRDVFRSENGK